MSAKYYIELENVSKSFSASGEVLKNINIKISKGEFVVLLGPSGSGKSTLLRIIAGLEQASGGTIQFQQNKKFDKSFVFQEAHLMPWRSCIENVALPLELMGLTFTERIEKAKAALAQVGLLQAEALFPAEMSGGMKMRASLARALTVQPDLLLLDEPFAALDEQTRFHLADELRALWLKNSMTVIFVTHSIQEACFLADRVLVLSEKPAQIVAEVKIDLPKMRTNQIRTEPEFLQQQKKLYAALEKKKA